MHKDTQVLIQNAARFLQTRTARKYSQFLRTPLATAVIILTAIEKYPQSTIAELSIETGIGKGIVTDTITALKKGGYPLTVTVAGTQGSKHLISIKTI
jgi:hypothetical protein